MAHDGLAGHDGLECDGVEVREVAARVDDGELAAARTLLSLHLYVVWLVGAGIGPWDRVLHSDVVRIELAAGSRHRAVYLHIVFSSLF